jgi:hypothetical protein
MDMSLAASCNTLEQAGVVGCKMIVQLAQGNACYTQQS